MQNPYNLSTFGVLKGFSYPRALNCVCLCFLGGRSVASLDLQEWLRMPSGILQPVLKDYRGDGNQLLTLVTSLSGEDKQLLWCREWVWLTTRSWISSNNRHFIGLYTSQSSRDSRHQKLMSLGHISTRIVYKFSTLFTSGQHRIYRRGRPSFPRVLLE